MVEKGCVDALIRRLDSSNPDVVSGVLDALTSILKAGCLNVLISKNLFRTLKDQLCEHPNSTVSEKANGLCNLAAGSIAEQTEQDPWQYTIHTHCTRRPLKHRICSADAGDFTMVVDDDMYIWNAWTSHEIQCAHTNVSLGFGRPWTVSCMYTYQVCMIYMLCGNLILNGLNSPNDWSIAWRRCFTRISLRGRCVRYRSV